MMSEACLLLEIWIERTQSITELASTPIVYRVLNIRNTKAPSSSSECRRLISGYPWSPE